jgi:hypothetical protein
MPHDRRPENKLITLRGCGLTVNEWWRFLTPSMRRFFHINYRPQITWLYPIYNRLNRTNSAALKTNHSKWESTELPELSLAVATKLVLLRTVVSRFNSDYRRLLDKIGENQEQIERNIKTGTVWTVPDDDALPFQLVADIDAFIFETRSAYEILGKYVTALFELLFGRRLTEQDLKEVLQHSGLDHTWTFLLQQERKLFFHNTAPWIAVALSESGNQYELIILRRNARNAAEPQDYATLSQYNDIFNGFMAALERLQSHILAEIEKFERENP